MILFLLNNIKFTNKHRQRLLLLSLTFILNLPLYSQYKKVVFAEVLGIGGYGSINFKNQIYSKKYHHFSYRVGISTYQITDFTTKFNPDIILPIGIEYGLGNQHRINIELGQVFSSIVQFDFRSNTPNRNPSLSPYFGFGYNYNKKESRFVFGAKYYRKYEFYEYVRNWAGFSIGMLI